MLSLFKQLRDRWAEQKKRSEEFREQIHREVHQTLDEIDREIKPLSIEEARRRAEALLSDPTRFECNQTPPTDDERTCLENLSPLLRGFFERYAYVFATGGMERLDRPIEPALEIIRGVARESDKFIKIGQDDEHVIALAKRPSICLMKNSARGKQISTKVITRASTITYSPWIAGTSTDRSTVD